jgi:leader peptidase (prepilin peptidase)/N-methyltransferase
VSSSRLPRRPGASNGRARLGGLAWQVPLAVVLAGVAVHGVGVRFELVGCLYLALVTPELCRVDVAEHRLPNALVLPGFAFAAVGVVFGWAGTGRPPVAAVLATVAVIGLFGMVALTGGMGMGDVKLAAVIALAGGAASVIVVAGAVVLGFLAAGVGALGALVVQGGAGNIAFGPYLLGGFWASVAALPLLG